MSQENVESFGGIEAYNRRDAQGLSTYWTGGRVAPALLVMLGGEPTVYRGHEGVRELLRDTDETLAEIHVDSEIRDPGDRRRDWPHPHARQGERRRDRIPASATSLTSETER